LPAAPLKPALKRTATGGAPLAAGGKKTRGEGVGWVSTTGTPRKAGAPAAAAVAAAHAAGGRSTLFEAL
jgi:hypothetical protein